MTEVTIIADDTNSNITYSGSWTAIQDDNDSTIFQNGFHFASSEASLTFPFYGGGHAVVRGSFIGANNAANSAQYPAFEIDASPMKCLPEVPQNGGQFLCSMQNFPTLNHTLTVRTLPNVSQAFRIDYIRYATTPDYLLNGWNVFIQSPNTTTRNFSFDAGWDLKPQGKGNDVQSAMQTSNPQSQVTYEFLGTSVAWWGCCLSTAVSHNVATASYIIDGQAPVHFQIDESSIQSANCKDEIILFQQSSLSSGSHNLTVIYEGNKDKIPLTLCAIAATPKPDILAALEAQPQSSSHPTHPSQHQVPTSTLGGPTPSQESGVSTFESDKIGTVLGGAIGGLVFFFLIFFFAIFLRRRRRMQRTIPAFDFDPQRPIRRVVPSVDLGAHMPSSMRTSMHKSIPPPKYRSSIAKSFSIRSFTIRPQQTAQVGSDYASSVVSLSPQESKFSFHSPSKYQTRRDIESSPP